MAFQVANNLRFRRSFGRIRKIIDLPYLIEIQKNSYELFLQKDAAPAERQSIGLQEVFKSVFPIKDFNETASLEFVSYSLGEPKYDVEECHQRGMTFAAPLKVTVQLVLWDVDQQTGSRSIKNVKEQEVYDQRHRAGDRQSAAPLAGSFLRTRQRKNPCQRQVALFGTGDSLPGLM